VNFYAGKEAVNMGKQAGDEAQPVPPEEICHPMPPQSMQAGVAKNDLGYPPGGRILPENGINIFFDGLKQDSARKLKRWLYYSTK